MRHQRVYGHYVHLISCLSAKLGVKAVKVHDISKETCATSICIHR